MKKLTQRIFGIAAVLALVAIVGVCMTACGNSGNNTPAEVSKDTYTARLEGAGYTVQVADDEELASAVESLKSILGETLGVDDIEWVMNVTKMDSETGDYEAVALVRFTNENAAKTAYNACKAQMEENADSIPANWKLSLSGKTIISGTEAAYNVALGK